MKFQQILALTLLLLLANSCLSSNQHHLQRALLKTYDLETTTQEKKNEMCNDLNSGPSDSLIMNPDNIDIQQVTHKDGLDYNLFDMSPTNMEHVQNTFSSELNSGSQWNEASTGSVWGVHKPSPDTNNDAERVKWMEVNNYTASSTYKNFITFGKSVNMGNTGSTYNDGAHYNKVVWMIETYNTSESLGGTIDEEHFSSTYKKDGKITVILCIGRWTNNAVKWNSVQSTFEVYQPFDSFLNTVDNEGDNEFPDKYFYGSGCSYIPPRPEGPDTDGNCIWAIKLGKFFVDGSVKNDISSASGVRECIQRVYGKRTHTLKCLFTGLDDNDGWRQVGTLATEDGYTDAEIRWIQTKLDQMPSNVCNGFTEVTTGDLDHIVTVKCECEGGILTGDSDKNWIYNKNTLDWTQKGHSCGTPRPDEFKNCRIWDKNSRSCQECKKFYFLTLDNECRTIDELNGMRNNMPSMPVGCHNAKILTWPEDINVAPTIECIMCIETYTPIAGICTQDGDVATIEKIPFCEFQYNKKGGTGDNGGRKCFSCISTHVLEKKNTDKDDECLFLDQVSFSKEKFKGCRFVSNPHNRVQITENPNLFNTCEECKTGYMQMSWDNTDCKVLKRMHLTEGVRREQAVRRNKIAMDKTNINGPDDMIDTDMDLYGTSGGPPFTMDSTTDERALNNNN